MIRLLPIRKIVAGLIASALFFLAHKLGFTFTDKDADSAAQGIVGFIVAYIVPDPRVQSTEHKFRARFRDKIGLLNTLATDALLEVHYPVPSLVGSQTPPVSIAPEPPHE